MHDRAQQLLTSPTQVTRQGDLPGLGLSLAQAHRHLLDRYRCQTQHHQWHTLPDDGYSYTYLTWHMEQADQPEQVHQLLQETNPTGGNGWYGACEARGKPATFVNDLGRAWRLAEQTYQQAPATALALLFRYALIRTSINSLASNIPPPLLAALVEKQIWQPAQGWPMPNKPRNPINAPIAWLPWCPTCQSPYYRNYSTPLVSFIMLPTDPLPWSPWLSAFLSTGPMRCRPLREFRAVGI